MLEKIEEQIKYLANKLEASAANHNHLIGAKAALENLYNIMVSATPAAEAVVAAVDPTAAPAVDAAVSATEAVVNAVE